MNEIKIFAFADEASGQIDGQMAAKQGAHSRLKIMKA